MAFGKRLGTVILPGRSGCVFGNGKEEMRKTIKTFSVVCACVITVSVQASNMDLRRVVQDVGILEDYSGNPDSQGVLESYDLLLPDFDFAAYYKSSWWPAGGNRVFAEIREDFTDLAEGGMFILLKLTDGQYLAILPISGPLAYSWFDAADGKLLLKMGTHGKAAVSGGIPLFSWMRDADPYRACYGVWKNALSCQEIKGAALMRQQKQYPEPFRYLGWCSWEHFKNRISEENILKAMRDIEKSRLPIRYILIDNGHFDRASLTPNEKFPNGYKTITAMRKPDKIKWVGIWYAFLGSNHGVSAPGKLDPISNYMYTCNAGKLLPVHDEQAARSFYEYMLQFAKRDGIDFLKVDFQTDALPFYAGVADSNPLQGLAADNCNAIGNPLAAATNLARVFQDVAAEQMGGLINCNWHNAVSIFNTKTSVVGRCSGDYKVGNLNRAKGHLHDSYAAMPWLGQIAWGDHDMFHSSDKFAGRMMAISKAMSGGPVYLSDEPTQFAPENILPLVFEDGRLLRPLAPAVPLWEDLFYKRGKGKLFRVVAPLSNRTAAIVLYNFDGGVEGDRQAIFASVTSHDYTRATALIQPYNGPWPVPEEGLLVYDWYNQKAEKLHESYNVSISGFGDRLIQISPIQNGWSVVGRTDKYLSAAAVEVVSTSDDQLVLKMNETGPLAVWTSRGRPTADNIEFVNTGNNLYKANFDIGTKDILIRIRR